MRQYTSLLWIVLLLRAFVEPVSSAYNPQNGGRQKCFSCMSRYYGATWMFAGYNRIYQEPGAFTDDCANPLERGADVPVQLCSDSRSCVTMVEDIKIGVGAKGYIRGCYSSVLLYGFNTSGVPSVLAVRSFCATQNLTQLVNKGQPFDSEIAICSCSGELCNGHPLRSSAQPLICLLCLAVLLTLVFR